MRTPGPYKVENKKEIVDDRGNMIAQTYSPEGVPWEEEDNAKFLAASHDMYEALVLIKAAIYKDLGNKPMMRTPHIMQNLQFVEMAIKKGES